MNENNEKYSPILILMIIRIIIGGLICIIVGGTTSSYFMGGMGILTLIAGALCIPATIFFFTKRSYFTWIFFIMAIITALGGCILAANPFMRLAAILFSGQSIVMVLVILMDILFIIYLALSKNVKDVFGTNLFKNNVDISSAAQSIADEQPPVYEQPMQQQSPVYEQLTQQQSPVYEQPMQQQPPVYEQPMQQQSPVYEQSTQQQSPVYEQPMQQQPPVYEQPTQEQPPVYEQSTQEQPTAYEQPTQTTQQEQQEKTSGKYTGLIVGLGIIVGVIIIAAILIGSFFGMIRELAITTRNLIADTMPEIADEIRNQRDYEDYTHDNLHPLYTYTENELTADTQKLIMDKLNQANMKYDIAEVSAYIQDNNFVISSQLDLPTNYNESVITQCIMEIENNENMIKARQNIAQVISNDIAEKTGLEDVPIIFEYYTPDGEVVRTVAE